MRVYPRDQACAFRFTAAAWGELSNFFPLAVPIAAGPWTFVTSEALYQACKFPAHPDIQQRIAEAPTAKDAAGIGCTPGLGIDPGWNEQRVEVSTRDPWWGARPVADRYEGHNVLGRLWMELRQHLRDNDPAAHSGAWAGRIRVGCLAGGAAVA